jgi:hypothetical protein
MRADGMSTAAALGLILLMHFVLPGVISFLISEFMRKMGWIAQGDMTLEV